MGSRGKGGKECVGQAAVKSTFYSRSVVGRYETTCFGVPGKWGSGEDSPGELEEMGRNLQ